MSHKLVNLAFPIVSERVDQKLAAQPALIRQQAAYSGFDVRQKLETYVLSRLPSCYIRLEANQVCSLESSQCYFSQQLQQIDNLVEQGIASLVSQRSQSAGSQERNSPSSWFG